MWSRLLIPITATLAATAVHAATSHAAVGAHSSLDHNKGSQNVANGENSNGKRFKVILHPDYPNHRVRIRESRLCGDKDKIHSGYFDIAEHTHLFFTFAESRDKPDEDALLLWLNGGPGCSSMTGFFVENGPCLVADEGKSSTFNPYSWNSNANMIFLDSPVKVGFSKARKPVDTSYNAAEDIYIFLQLFYQTFSGLVMNDFHVMGESYAGRYIPNLASLIFNKNKQLEGASRVPLVSMAIGNGFVEIVSASRATVDYPCVKGIYDKSTCEGLRGNISTCIGSAATCRQNPTRDNCLQAEADCLTLGEPFYKTGINPYDITKPCDRSPSKDGPLCYKELTWLQTYLNRPEIRAELDVDAKAKPFEDCNYSVHLDFLLSADWAGNTPDLVRELLEGGIKLLAYVGVNDFMCNYLGVRDWTSAVKWRGQQKYVNAPFTEFKMSNGTGVGRTKSSGPLTYLELDGAGHMVPYNQPAVALDMIKRWIKGDQF